MPTIKEETIHLIESLDDDCSLEDIQYHIYVRQKIERGLKAYQNGQTLTHEQVKEKLAPWIS